MDVAMYLAQTLVQKFPTLKWGQVFNNKKFADYGQPLLFGFGSVPLNPVAIVITLAQAIVSKKQTGKRLLELYNYWSDRVQPSA